MFAFNITKWEMTRAKGLKNFVLMNGVLGWGIPLGIFVALMHVLENGWQKFGSDLMLSIAIYAVAGVFFGLATWAIAEWRYARVLAKAAR
jgi:hypothetical protein